MTILTGDFTFEAHIGGHRSTETPASDDCTSNALPEDAQLYLRHVEHGESIRAIARQADCHASTILRRIRRFEARRDDPLIDAAVENRDKGASLKSPDALATLRRLAEPGALMAVASGMDKAIVTRDGIRTGILDRRLAEAMALNAWVVQVGNGRVTSYAIAPAGRDALRQRMSADSKAAAMPRPQDFRDSSPVDQGDQGPAQAEQHRIWSEREIRDPENGQRRRARVNIAESPLLVLARRRDANGEPFLTRAMVAAGERLREDFELAQLGPRTTQNWGGFMTAGIDVSRSGVGYRGGSEAARNRVAIALRELGPGMGDVVLRVCCFLEGIEQTERLLGWSARSGKIVLRLALMRLDRHYTESYGKGSPLIG
ncbi:DUF6456 domain-containing protein [Paracoccus tegillarcae]|uniref:Helix-turn-helix domain containing protein n=1 Tax=Paracoccus tegillarcae TaxID=1529068 RepID=A0A2K9F6I5_9RHOB|nr:DUF6456 domain-containing protein [Paracoccus tegillarcae]AUH34791.1 helix-turn-helix domain containing protein [Paracoccus tegillarcae]